MRSEKTRTDYFSRVSKEYGKAASEYLQATASTFVKPADLLSTVCQKKGLAREIHHFARLDKPDLQATRGDVFRDLTNLETAYNIDRYLAGASHGPCKNENCKKNAALLEKSTAMLEKLKIYVTQAVEKTPAKKFSRTATTQTDPDTPGRKNVSQMLDFTWTTNVKRGTLNLGSEAKIEVWKTVATQTVEEYKPLTIAKPKIGQKDQACQVATENKLHKEEVDSLLKSLYDADKSKAFLEKKLSQLSTGVSLG